MRNRAIEKPHNHNNRKIVKSLRENKRLYFFVICISLLAAFVYNKTVTILYDNTATILISEKEQYSSDDSHNLRNRMPFFAGKSNNGDEVEILKSFSLVKEAIQRMDMKTAVYSFEKSVYSNLLEKVNIVKKTEFYNTAPIIIITDPTHDQATDLPFYVEFIDENTFRLSVKEQNDPVQLFNFIDDKVVGVKSQISLNSSFNFGQDVKTDFCSFKVLKTNNFDTQFTKEKVLYFKILNTNYLTLDYQKYLTVSPVNSSGSIIALTLKGTNYYRVSDFLNVMISVFMDRNLHKKNNAASSTVLFIDAQLAEYKDSLATAENSLKSFRTSRQGMNLSFQGQQVFARLDQLESERILLRDQQRYYLYIKDYFGENKELTGLLTPSSMNVVDPMLTSLVMDLIATATEQSRLIGNKPGDNNTMIPVYDARIDSLKRTIIENIDNSLVAANSSLAELDYRISKLSNQISAMPKTEIQLKGIERKFEMNSEIYTYLLQKRSEALIAKAASMPDYEILEPARAIAPQVVSPHGNLNFLLAFLLGLFIPTLYIFTIRFFSNKLTEADDIEALAGKPVLGKIFHNHRRTTLVVSNQPNSSVSESFRSIWTNFQFFDHSGKKQVVLFTSSASGDGKTFCSINFASTLALSGFKTVLLEFDLRRPKVHQEFGTSNMIGISSLLIDKAVIEDIILHTEIENLDLISAGPAAPNPAELIASDRMSEFLETLKEMYDYIIIDSAPVGVISETFMLMKHSDVNIFVVRLDYTIRDAYINALKAINNNGFSNYTILINDLDIRKEAYRHSDTKYYSEDNGNLFSRLFRRFAKS
jgi:tyrosine-protein kinase Etk/Wzc